MKKTLIGLGLFFGAAASAPAQTPAAVLNNITLSQNPKDRVVEITYELTDGAPVYVTLGITTNGVAIPDPVTVSGDVTTMWAPAVIEPGVGAKTIRWGAKHDWPGNLTDDARATVTAWFTNDPPAHLLLLARPEYVVVDLSGGASAERFPVRGTALPPEASEASKTTELWLRRIPAGTFTMGSPNATQLPPDGELGRVEAREYQRSVTFMRDFYIGVFQLTQRQWTQVMGTTPSQYAGNTRPVERVTYNAIRGATDDVPSVNWPVTGHTVSPDSFMGRLRAKASLLFDLPTDAQWEYACRAGTTGAWNNGTTTVTDQNVPDANLDLLGRYLRNQNDGKGGYTQHTVVGMYQPNDWGLYDMHGNVLEWCLDWYLGNLATAPVTAPHGPASGTTRIARGGAYNSEATILRSAGRSSNAAPDTSSNSRGFRVSIQFPGQ